jgi:hypothetical protein
MPFDHGRRLDDNQGFEDLRPHSVKYIHGTWDSDKIVSYEAAQCELQTQF